MTNSTVPNSPETIKNVRDFFKSQPVAILATVTAKNKPHAAVIYTSINDDMSLTFVTKADTFKSKNIKHNNSVMIVGYEASSQTTVQVEGHAIDITDTPEAADVFKGTLHSVEETSESGIPPISKLDAGHYVAYKVVPTQIRMAVFARPDPGGYDMYEVLNF